MSLGIFGTLAKKYKNKDFEGVIVESAPTVKELGLTVEIYIIFGTVHAYN